MWKAVSVLAVAGAIFASGAEAPGQAPENLGQGSGSAEVLAAYMPWFGDQGHIRVGYSSQDPKALSRQMDQARSRGISGFVVHWTGPQRHFTDQAFALLEQIASEKHFQVALLYNES